MPAPDPPTLTALRQGEPDAWRALFETYGEPLYLYAFHRCNGDAAAAEDIRQETLITAIERIDSFRGDGPIFGWLCGIARHKCADWARRGAREPAFPGLADLADEDAAEPVDGEQPLPEDQAIRGELRAEVVEALWSLPEAYRKALVWRYGRGESVDELARRFDKPYKAVESLLSRARSALRETLRSVDPE